MQIRPGDSGEVTVRETAARFLEAIKKSDSRAFWDTLDKKGQGYFLGIWFYAMESMSIDTIVALTGEDSFLDGVLGPIISGLRESMGDLLEDPVLGEVQYSTPHSATIRVSPGRDPNPDADQAEFIPLVLELSDFSGAGASPVLTVWKVDTLHCFQLNKAAH
ncbi:MAG: hypothetical protein K6T66_07070 [Peptococcaceae bacterium]|nr:hypothetical protein [Peptococcaceae bacterium]